MLLILVWAGFSAEENELSKSPLRVLVGRLQ